MGFTREQWSRDFLAAIGNPNPSRATVDWVVGWTVAETQTGGGATYNLLNTTQYMGPGDTLFNYLNAQHTFGVENYTSYAEGIGANADVLQQNHPGYSSILAALRTNDINSLSGPSGGVRQGLTTWCGGCGYGIGFQQTGAAHRNDAFNYGNAQPVAAGSGGGGASPQIATGGDTTAKLDPCTQYEGQWWNLPILWACQLGSSYGTNLANQGTPGFTNDPTQAGYGSSSTDWGAMLQNLMLFLLALVFLYIGLRLLFPSISGPSDSAIDKLTGALSEGESQSAQPSKSQERAKKVETVAKVAALA